MKCVMLAGSVLAVSVVSGRIRFSSFFLVMWCRTPGMPFVDITTSPFFFVRLLFY